MKDDDIKRAFFQTAHRALAIRNTLLKMKSVKMVLPSKEHNGGYVIRWVNW